ncbi:MAG: ribosome assembly RNA-binding protein YhbY [Bacillota bacterium]|nr:ribosome assembly RNA-binding protein YhbY [Bacillota bacterium]
MLTGKQRSYLKGLAHSLKPLAQLGKEGLSEGFINQLSELLDLHELVKVNVLDNSSEDAQEVALEAVKLLDAEFVQCIGHKFIIYRQSRTNPMRGQQESLYQSSEKGCSGQKRRKAFQKGW